MKHAAHHPDEIVLRSHPAGVRGLKLYVNYGEDDQKSRTPQGCVG